MLKLNTGRIIIEYRGGYVIMTASGEEIHGKITGKKKFMSQGVADLPKVGDYVTYILTETGESAVIQELLPRKTVLSRKKSGHLTVPQVIATNIDTVFIVMGLDRNFNIRRLERFLALTYESGANPVIVLNKADLSDDLEMQLDEVSEVAFGASICVISAKDSINLDMLESHIQPGDTICFVGSSGVGKSTLINRILGEDRQAVGETRESDDRGRHTTTRRELIPMPDGAFLIDTPGIREIQLWDSEDGMKEGFPDIDILAENCFFTDCAHETEKGCAVLEALDQGELDPDRYMNYMKLRAEMQVLKERQQVFGKKQNSKRRFRAISKQIRKHPKLQR